MCLLFLAHTCSVLSLLHQHLNTIHRFYYLYYYGPTGLYASISDLMNEVCKRWGSQAFCEQKVGSASQGE